MNKTINCAETMSEVLTQLKKSKYWDANTECKEEWNKDYAIILVSLLEEEYRDYDQLMVDLMKAIKTITKDIPIVHGYKPVLPADGYVLQCHPIGRVGLEFEFELYKIKSKVNSK